MRLVVGVYSWSRVLSQEPSERRLLIAAVVMLIRQRKRLLTWAAPLLAGVPVTGRPKIALWCQLATALRGHQQQQPVAPDLMLTALKSTHAYTAARERLTLASSGVFLRGVNYRSLRQTWRQQLPQRVFIFHHYDKRGVLAQSWFEVLLAIQAAGWQVVLSTSALEPEVVTQLSRGGIQIALRCNIALCLGAYRDLSILLSDTLISSRLCSLVLCNDSNLPIQAPAALLQQLQGWVDLYEPMATPALAGLTDSAERDRYHLQSFFLYANHALLTHSAWLRFWLDFCLQGSKDDLIDRGEISLTQALLASNVQVLPSYPLTKALLSDPGIAEELLRYGISQPSQVNQSLFAWQSLLRRGYPLVKKHVLFDLVENMGLSIAMAELAQWIPKERYALLLLDLQQQFMSRYSENRNSSDQR